MPVRNWANRVAAVNNLAGEDGNAILEFVAWVALIAMPILALGLDAIKAEQDFAAAQNMAREAARSVSLGREFSSSGIAADFGVDSRRFTVETDCVLDGSTCAFARAWVTVTSDSQMPPALALFPMQAP